MTISPEQIIAHRLAGLRRVRFTAFVLLILACCTFMYWITDELSDELMNWDGVDDWGNSMYMLAFVVPAALVLAFQRRLAQWLAPVPRDECHECGYRLKGLRSTTCPECGAALGEGGRPRACAEAPDA